MVNFEHIRQHDQLMHFSTDSHVYLVAKKTDVMVEIRDIVSGRTVSYYGMEFPAEQWTLIAKKEKPVPRKTA